MNDQSPRIIIGLGEDGSMEIEFEGSPPAVWGLSKILQDNVADVVRSATENRIQYTRDMEQRILKELDRRAGRELREGMAP